MTGHRWFLRAKAAVWCLIGRPVVIHCDLIDDITFGPETRRLVMSENCITGGAVRFHGWFTAGEPKSPPSAPLVYVDFNDRLIGDPSIYLFHVASGEMQDPKVGRKVMATDLDEIESLAEIRRVHPDGSFEVALIDWPKP